jgi:exopolysaccharide production protein ExoQ
MTPPRGTRGAMVFLGLAYAAILVAHLDPIGQLVRAAPVVGVLVVLGAGPQRLLEFRVPLALLVFGTWAVASLWWSVDPSGTSRAVLDMVALLVVGWAAGALLPLARVRRVLSRTFKAMLMLTVGVLVLFPGWSTRPTEVGGPLGWHSIFTHKNGLGGFVALALLTFWFDRGRYRWVWLIAGVVLLIGSRSSTALLLVLASAAVLLWQRCYRAVDRLHVRAVFAGVSASVLLVGGTLLVFRPSLFTALLERNDTFTGRTEVWAAVVRHVAERPLAGHGWSGIWRQSSPITQEIWREARFEAFYAHNGYLDLLLQVGLVGTGLLALALAPAVVRSWRKRVDPAFLWAFLVLLVTLLAATTESSPLTGSGLLVLALVVSSMAQRHGGAEVEAQDGTVGPVLDGADGGGIRTPLAARRSSSSR